MNRLSRIVSAAARVGPAWRALWALAMLGAIAAGIAAPGDFGYP